MQGFTAVVGMTSTALPCGGVVLRGGLAAA